jgi:hypothetical protein
VAQITARLSIGTAQSGAAAAAAAASDSLVSPALLASTPSTLADHECDAALFLFSIAFPNVPRGAAWLCGVVI